MVKIRNRIQLQDEISREFAWRKKELHELKTLVRANEGTRLRDLCIRSAVPLLYAHWEGFVKRIGTCYLEFVARQHLRHEELPSNFLSIAMGSIVQNATSSRKVRLRIELVDFFRSKMSERSNLNWRSAIDTRSNLSSVVFQDIVIALGLDYATFESKEKLIDEKLLSNRNRIAHGQHVLVGFDEYLDLHDEILQIMQAFYQQVDNASFNGDYRLP